MNVSRKGMVKCRFKRVTMKRFLLLAVVFFCLGGLFAQHAPVAVNDFAHGILGKLLTVKVVENDYHPDGLSFKVSGASMAHSFTDSTITFSVSYERYYNVPDTITFRYSLKDENGTTGTESIGKVFVIIDNGHYFNYLDYNNIKARVQAIGLQFWSGPLATTPEQPKPEFEFPQGSKLNTIFNSSLWIGGMDELDSLKLAAELYRRDGFDYWPGPLGVQGALLTIDTTTVVKWQKVWKLTAEEVIYHKFHYRDEDYQMSSDIATWPAHGDPNLHQNTFLAPFMDVDGDSEYIPGNGDYPLIRGDQCIYFITNDLRMHTETGGAALGLEIHGMAYEFNSEEESPINNTVFFSYKIFNRSANNYHDAYIGLFTDFDIGDSHDDFVGCDVARGTYFGYNGDSLDGEQTGQEGTYGTNPPAQGIVILGGPLLDENGLDDPDGQCDESINGIGFGDGIADNERFGMKKFIWFNNSQGIQGDPEEAQDYYNYLRSVWKDGTAMEYGGNGHLSSGAYGPAASFMFPGLSDPCFWGTGGEEPFGPVDWTEVSAGNQPSDRRGLSVMGPFTFEAGSMERVDIAYVAAFPDEQHTALETLLSYVDEVKAEYTQDPTYFGYQWLSVQDPPEESKLSKLRVFPNPVKSVMFWNYESANAEAQYKLTNIMGKTVMTGQMEKDGKQSIDVSSLESGLYFLSVIEKNGVTAAKVLINH